jgi:catechol-2,3-dioxygenase
VPRERERVPTAFYYEDPDGNVVELKVDMPESSHRRLANALEAISA